jgi:Na+/H+ antiporter NhaD/arsenite permease-like protein
MISAIIITAYFIGMLILIFFNKVNRAILALGGALLSFFTLIVIENDTYIKNNLIELIIGKGPNYFNLQAIILILGMIFIVQICHLAGVFQYFAFKLIQITKGKPFRLFILFSSLAFFLSALLNNIVTVIILIPLTIVVSRILRIDPSPYIVSEAVLVNVGTLIFSISSIPSILISTSAGITFNEFFINIGLYALVLFVITLLFFQIYYRNKLMIPKEKTIANLLEFNVWNYVSNKNLFYKSIFTFLAVLICFILIPPDLISPGIIALTGAMVLAVISRLDGKTIIQKIDFELMLYLFGIFIMVGAIEYTGVIDIFGNAIAAFSAYNEYFAVILIVWLSAFLCTSIDNLPITTALIPVVNTISSIEHMTTNSAFYGLAFGVNLGNTLLLKGEHAAVLQIAEQNERPIKVRQFRKLAFVAMLLQLTAVTIYFLMIFDYIIGFFTIFLTLVIVLFSLFFRYMTNSFKKEERLIFSRVLRKVKNPRYRRKKKLIFQEFSRKFIRPNLIRDRKLIVQTIIRNIKRFLEELF